MMEATRTSETLVNFYQTARCYNPEDSNLHTHRRENLKSYFLFFVFQSVSRANTVNMNAPVPHHTLVKQVDYYLLDLSDIRNICNNRENSGFATHVHNYQYKYGTMQQTVSKIDSENKGNIINMKEDYHICLYKKQEILNTGANK
jgi:hypothetical protein